MAEVKDKITDEMLPEVITPASAPMALDAMADMVEYIEKFIQKLLKRDVDYGRIPGTTKDTLYKAGAEKLCFAFSLSPHYEVLSEKHDLTYEWEYSTKVNGKPVKKTGKGYHRYQVMCTLKHRATNIIWATCIGECESTERGRETAPSNTIIKLAEKRSYDGATLHATFTSDRFTADMDTYDRPTPKGQPKKSAATPPGETPNPSASTPSKYGEENRKSKCNFCEFIGKPKDEQYHVLKGHPIVQHPGPGDLQGKWGHADCYAATFEKTESDDKPDPEQTGDPIRVDVIKSILGLEKKIGLGDKSFKIDVSRIDSLGTVDLGEATNDGLVKYMESLQQKLSA